MPCLHKACNMLCPTPYFCGTARESTATPAPRVANQSASPTKPAPIERKAIHPATFVITFAIACVCASALVAALRSL